MSRYRKRPIEVEAEQFFAGKRPWPDGVVQLPPQPDWPKSFIVETLEGPLMVSEGDWIITGIKGEKYPIKDEIFTLTYEPVG